MKRRKFKTVPPAPREIEKGRIPRCRECGRPGKVDSDGLCTVCLDAKSWADELESDTHESDDDEDDL